MLALYVLALVLQIGGVYFVIHDAVKSKANARVFSEKWDELDGPRNPKNWPEPKQTALANWVKSENAVTDLRRFAPVVVLLLGLSIGFVGNALSLYIPAAPSTVAPVAPATAPVRVTPTR